MLGMFALNPVGITGSIVQQLNHGISTGALFLLVGVVYERRHTREISEYGGLSKVMPVYAAIFLVMTMSSIGLPTLNGFIGEFLILQGVFVASKMWAAFAASGIVLGAAYMLYLYQRTMFGKIENPKNEQLLDLSRASSRRSRRCSCWRSGSASIRRRSCDRLETSVQHVVARVSPQYAATVRPTATRRRPPRAVAASSNAAAQFLSAAPCDVRTASRSPATGGRPEDSADAARHLVAATSTTSCRSSCSRRARCSCSIADVLLPRGSSASLGVGRRWPCSARRPLSLVPFADAHVEVAHGLIAVDRFALFFKVIFLVAAALTVLMSVRYLEIEGAQPRRVLLPDPLRHARHDDHGRRHRSHHDLHRPRDDGGVVLHPGRLHQAEPAVERGGGEVLPARRVLARHPAVRHVAACTACRARRTCARWRRRSPGRSAIRGWCSR